MTKSWITLALLAAATLAGCMSPHAYIRNGDANSVEIMYGGDLDSSSPLAREFCARYDRTPRLANHTTDSALYDCVPRPKSQ